MRVLSHLQLQALRSYEQFGEPPDLYEYDSSPAPLIWHNRERTISSLIKRGLLDKDYKVTEAGLRVLAAMSSGR